MLFEVTTIRLWHAGVCVQRISRVKLDEAARPHELSRSGYGVLGIVATRFGSAVNNWSCSIEQCWRSIWSYGPGVCVLHSWEQVFNLEMFSNDGRMQLMFRVQSF
jgi:hypothetical protein